MAAKYETSTSNSVNFKGKRDLQLWYKNHSLNFEEVRGQNLKTKPNLWPFFRRHSLRAEKRGKRTKFMLSVRERLALRHVYAPWYINNGDPPPILRRGRQVYVTICPTFFCARKNGCRSLPQGMQAGRKGRREKVESANPLTT